MLEKEVGMVKKFSVPFVSYMLIMLFLLVSFVNAQDSMPIAGLGSYYQVDSDSFFDHEDDFEVDFVKSPVIETGSLTENNLGQAPYSKDYAVRLRYTVQYPTFDFTRQYGVAYDHEDRGDVRLGLLEEQEETICTEPSGAFHRTRGDSDTGSPMEYVADHRCDIDDIGSFFGLFLEEEGYPDNPFTIKFEGDVMEIETIGLHDEGQESYPRPFWSGPQPATGIFGKSANPFAGGSQKNVVEAWADSKQASDTPYANVYTRFRCPTGTVIETWDLDQGDETASILCDIEHDIRDIEIPFSFTDEKVGIFNYRFLEGSEDKWTYNRQDNDGSSGRRDGSEGSFGGLVYIEAEQDGQGSSSESAYWEKEIELDEPISDRIYIEGTQRKIIREEEDSDSCSYTDNDGGTVTHSASAQGNVDSARLRIRVHDTASGWETLHSDGSTSTGDTGLTRFKETYNPSGQIDKVRIQMEGVAEGERQTSGPNQGSCPAVAEAGSSFELIVTHLMMKMDYETPTIDWDGNQIYCEGIGGDWLDEDTQGLTTSPEHFSHERGDYRCCGDDWVWIYNLPVGYDQGIDTMDATGRIEAGDPICLYDPLSLTLEDIVGFKADDFDESIGNYRCPRTTYDAYDPALTLADDYRIDPESVFGHHEDLFYLSGSADDTSVRTDMGKWTPWDGDNWERSDAMFCYHEFDQDAEYGESFEWLSIEEASDKNQKICDVYLGYNWTGSKCCFEDRNDMDVVTYDDTELSCNSTYALEYTFDRVPYAFSSPDFKHEFFDECDRIINQNPYNPACFEGQPVQNNTATYTEPDVRGVFNKNGVLRFCNREEGETGYEGDFEHVDKCGLRGMESYPHVCGYKNDSWFNSDLHGPYLGRFEEYQKEFSREELENNISTSSLPFDDGNMPSNLVDKQQQECCFFGSCWNGTQCVGLGRYHEIGSHGMYMVHEDEWVPYDISLVDTTDPDATDVSTYMCQEGQWIESDPMFNWYYDLSRPGFCTGEHQCFYKDADESEYDIAYSLAEFEEDELDRQGGFLCTKDENAYTQDHYCEAIYDNGNLVDSRWTSRTKLVALQLRQIAEDNAAQDYILFCGHKEDSVNNPYELHTNRLPDGYDVNNVCVLQYGENMNKTAMGFSFNSPSDATDSMGDFLSAAQGFFNRIDHGDVNECEVKNGDDAGKHGVYTRCIDNELWVNEKTESVIYSKEGIGIGNNQLPDSDLNAFDVDIDEMLNALSGIINEGDNLPDSPSLLLNPADFRNFYVKSTGSNKIIGFMEERWDTSLGHQERPVPYYIAVKYPQGSDICDKVDFAQQKYGYPIYCYERDGNEYVLGNNYPSKDLPEPRTPDFWKGLAPRIRVI